MTVEQIPITDPRLVAALHALRVEFCYCQFRDFPLFGFDAIRQMGINGLCTQEEAEAAIAEAQRKVARDEILEDIAHYSEPLELEGPPFKLFDYEPAQNINAYHLNEF